MSARCSEPALKEAIVLEEGRVKANMHTTRERLREIAEALRLLRNRRASAPVRSIAERYAVSRRIRR